LDLLLAIAGAAVTILVVAGMVLITPRGQVQEAPAAEPRASAATEPRFDRSRRLPDPVLAPAEEPVTRLDGAPTDLRPA
ncbi:MAG: hypothetical protein AVDCRST_MAG69-511, partial [uncultured Solirubrobacteraceae bacterium]